MLSQLSYSPTGGASYLRVLRLSKRRGRLRDSLPEWRNWHTQGTQNAPAARPCGFESHLRHRVPAARTGGLVPNTRVVRASIAVAMALCVLAPAAASAKGRDFTGVVASIDATQLVVENRHGATQRFERSEKTEVRGRESWDAIRAGDEVVVRWRLGSGPRKARRVIVLSGD